MCARLPTQNVAAERVLVTEIDPFLRHSDFLHGLPISDLPSITAEINSHPLFPADRLRLIHNYITSVTSDGGLGIVPGSKEWDHVDSVLGLHDPKFNEEWIRIWTTKQITSAKLEKIREQVHSSVHPSDLLN